MEWKTILKLYDHKGRYLTAVNVPNGILTVGDNDIIYAGYSYTIRAKSVFVKTQEVEFRAYSITSSKQSGDKNGRFG